MPMQTEPISHKFAATTATPKSILKSANNRSMSVSDIGRRACPIDNAALPESVGESSPTFVGVNWQDSAQQSLLQYRGATMDVLGAQRTQDITALPGVRTPPQRRSVSNTHLPRSTGGGDEVDKSPALVQKERIAAFEARRRRSTGTQDAQLRNLLKVQAAQARPTSLEEHAAAARRRDNYETKRLEDVKRRRDRAQETRELITHRLEEFRAPFDIEHRVVDMVWSKAGCDGLGGLLSEVTADVVDECYAKAKTEISAPRIQEWLKSTPLKYESRDVLSDTILKSSQPWAWTACFRIRSAFPHELAEFFADPDLTCPICMDPMISLSDDGREAHCNYWSAASRKNEHWNNYACGHAFCGSCAQTWAETAINQQELHVKCPAEGCKYRLWDQDLKELLSAKMYDRHEEHKHVDHLKNLKNIVKHDGCLMDWLRANARPCPECHVIVSRSEGCNVMTCVCGTRFCYKCGFKQCQCSSHDKAALASIWQPKA